MANIKFPGYLLQFSRYIAGIVFIYSGFVKGIDPLGSAYKFADYFTAFNISFLEPYSLAFSIILSSAEILIGITLVAGVHMIIASWAILLFMSFFTVLTFIIALMDPVSDCGCFGDALILTNWETFWKNVVLMVFVIYLFINRRKFGRFFSKPAMEWSSVAGFIILILVITGYSYLNLPIIDFRPYNVGANIEEKMSVPPDAPGDEYDITLYYQKNGETRPFSVDSLPDSSWEWVRTESTLISKGYEPPITGFYIESVGDGTDYTMDILTDEGYTFMMIAWDLKKVSGKALPEIDQLAAWSAASGTNFICLTGSPEPEITDFKARTGADYDFYYSDEIILKTMIRSNPGIILLKEGTIIGKWHYRNLPDTGELKEKLLSWSLEQQTGKERSLVTLGYIMAALILILILNLIRLENARPAESISEVPEHKKTE